MSDPQKWDWAASNGNATAEETATAYTALSTGGKTRDFVAAVWNDIIAKISEQRISWRGKEWDASILSLDDTKLSAGENMTAVRFNSAVSNIWPVESWPWADTLGRTEIKKGDRCYGVYFLHLVDGLNYWIEDLTPIFFSWELQASAEITPTIKLYTALPVKLNLNATHDMTCDASVFPALIIEALLNVKDDTTVSAVVMRACIADVPLSVKANIDVDIKVYAAAMARVINFVRHTMSANMKVCGAVPFSFTDNFVCKMKGTVLTGNLVYTALDLDFISSIKVDAKTVSALFLNAGLGAEHGGSCSMVTPPCIHFAFDLGGHFRTTANANLLQALSTGAELNAVHEAAVRAYECWAMYLARMELHGQMETTASILTAVVRYVAWSLSGRLNMSVSTLCAKIAYLSGSITGTDETTVAASVYSALSTGVQLDVQLDSSVSASVCNTTNVSAEMQSETETTARIVLMPAATVKAKLEMKASTSVDVRFANKELVLASEIDDVLVSTLDDQTVDSVETKFT